MGAHHTTRKAKIIATGIFLFFILAAVGLSSLPYLTTYQIKKAIDQNNSAKLRDYIDFKSVRQDLKDQIKAFLASKMEILQKSNQLIKLLGSDLAESLANKMAEKVLDAVVTPKGLNELMRGKIILGQITGRDKEQEEAQPPDVSMHYESFSKFVVEIKDRSQPEREIKLILTRSGLEWSLTAIKLPMNTIPAPNFFDLGRLDKKDRTSKNITGTPKSESVILTPASMCRLWNHGPRVNSA